MHRLLTSLSTSTVHNLGGGALAPRGLDTHLRVQGSAGRPRLVSASVRRPANTPGRAISGLVAFSPGARNAVLAPFRRIVLRRATAFRRGARPVHAGGRVRRAIAAL